MADQPISGTQKKRLAVFLDGTWNEEGDNTNVWRLRSLCEQSMVADGTQLVYYDTGVGTRFGEKVRGGIYGYGIDQNVRKPYQWLVENYVEGDDIFIFGFSRGAFTARSLAGLISICGLASPGAPLGIGQLYARYKTVDRNHRSIRSLHEAEQKGETGFSIEEQWMLRYSRPVSIQMLGVWDTVGALGVPLPILRKFGAARHAFLDTNLRKDMQHAFHALAIDEHRASFTPTLWTQSTGVSKGPPVDVRDLAATEQRWFVGAHANVGGGYPSDLLPQLPLKWLMSKAARLGLNFRGPIDIDPDAHKAPIANSYRAFFHGCYQFVSRPHFRPIGAAPVVKEGWYVKSINETIDESVFSRWRDDKTYRPANLAEWAKRLAVDPITLRGSVRADTAAVIP